MLLCAPLGLLICSCSLLCQILGDILGFTFLSSPTAVLKPSTPSTTLHLYCLPQILPLTGLPVLCLAFLIFFFSLGTESIQVVDSCKPRGGVVFHHTRLTPGFCHGPHCTAKHTVVYVQHGLSLCRPICPFSIEPLPLYGAINTTACGSSC